WGAPRARPFPRAPPGPGPAEGRLVSTPSGGGARPRGPGGGRQKGGGANPPLSGPPPRACPITRFGVRGKHAPQHPRRWPPGRLPAVRVTDAARPVLVELLHRAVYAASKQLRDRLRPLIENVLTEVNLRPANLPERVARDKLVEELLDRVAARGFLTLGDLRD